MQLAHGQTPTGANCTCRIGAIWTAIVGVSALTAKTFRKIRINPKKDMKK
ncbi:MULTISPECIES: hypothetical protein [unclassified Sphingopyxis]|nr:MULTISPECIES: hypothetical protein [unclassified Sphingopyxis]